MTHTDYEDLLIKNKRSLAPGTFYHTLHHRYFECNYGNQEIPWDRWFRIFHDGIAKLTSTTRDWDWDWDRKQKQKQKQKQKIYSQL